MVSSIEEKSFLCERLPPLSNYKFIMICPLCQIINLLRFHAQLRSVSLATYRPDYCQTCKIKGLHMETIKLKEAFRTWLSQGTPEEADRCMVGRRTAQLVVQLQTFEHGRNQGDHGEGHLIGL